ncbi:MAG: transposase [Verrucomicrobiia bacterium]
MRWPEGFCCPHCGSERAWRTRRGLWLCGQCRRFVSATVGTLFENTRIPLTTWFCAAWELCAKNSRPTTAEFRKALGLGSNKTAWACLRTRSAVRQTVRSALSASSAVFRLNGHGDKDSNYFSRVSVAQTASLLFRRLPNLHVCREPRSFATARGRLAVGGRADKAVCATAAGLQSALSGSPWPNA